MISPSHAASFRASLASLLAVVAASSLLAALAPAAPPSSWTSVGTGGGGAMFSPSFSPHAADTLYASCDMGELFRTTNLGQSWNPVHFLQLRGNRPSRVQFTSDPNVLYCVDSFSFAAAEGTRVSRSADGGATWTPVAGTMDGDENEVFYLQAAPDATNRLLATSYSTLYFSSDGGATFNSRFTYNPGGAGLYVAGSFWDGDNIYVGTNAGLLVSTNGGASFAVSGVGGIAAGHEIVSLCGAISGATTRLWALTTAAGLYGGIFPEDLFDDIKNVYTLDVGGASWNLRTTGLPTGAGNGFVHIGCARANIDIAWLAGDSAIDHPMVYRTTNGGAAWSNVLFTVDNVNVATGWAGHQGDRDWTYGEGTLGFAVSPADPGRAAFTDLGFVHVTSDAGATWRQAYVDPSTQHPAGAATPKRAYYKGNGLENTTCWNMTWLDADTIWASCTDTRGMRSTDGGATWSFDYSGHTENTSYDVVVRGGTAYMATASVHDLYKTTYLTDARIDGSSGRILMSADLGASWQSMHDFGAAVFDLELDPNNADTMYACVVDSATGGIYRSTNLSLGASSTWSPLAAPASTEGHPYRLRVLDDGTLVATYSGRRDGGVFTASSGVFVSENAGASWLDRRDTNMHYYVKDITIDPHDAAQNTWYVGVWSGYGGPFTENNEAGGLYRTENRGASWTRILTKHRVTSCTVAPADPDELYVTTETEGLWYTANLGDAAPDFELLDDYPFAQPEVVVFDPTAPTRVWATSFGNSIRFGDTAPIQVDYSAFSLH